MESLLAIVTGVLFSAGLYMMLRRSIVKLIIGLALLGHAANLLIFVSAGLTRGEAPLIANNTTTAAAGITDSIPQALILTAIVIGFGVLAFAVVLIYRAIEATKTDDTRKMRATDS